MQISTVSTRHSLRVSRLAEVWAAMDKRGNAFSEQGKHEKSRSPGTQRSQKKQEAAHVFKESGLSSAHALSGELTRKLAKGNCNQHQITLMGERQSNPRGKGKTLKAPGPGAEFDWVSTTRGVPNCCLVELEHAHSFSSLFFGYPTGNMLIFQRKIMHHDLLIRNVQHCDKFFIKSNTSRYCRHGNLIPRDQRPPRAFFFFFYCLDISVIDLRHTW